MENIEKKAAQYAEKEIRESFPTAPDDTKRLLVLLLKAAFIQGAEAAGASVLLEKIEVAAELATFK